MKIKVISFSIIIIHQIKAMTNNQISENNSAALEAVKVRVLGFIAALAPSKGFYGRLLADISRALEGDDKELRESAEAFIMKFKNCRDLVDFTLELEA